MSEDQKISFFSRYEQFCKFYEDKREKEEFNQEFEDVEKSFITLQTK